MPPKTDKPLRIAILISGRGSNMQALVNTINTARLPVEVCVVLANKANAKGLAWAQAQNLPTHIISHTDFSTRADFDAALLQYLQSLELDYILLAGFMLVLGKKLVESLNGKIINIHPSLLPAFPGLHTHQQALAAGVQVHGCTIHFVTPVLDHGPIIAQGAIAVQANDSADDLAARLLPVEHQVYSQVLQWLAAGTVKLETNGLVTIDGVKSRLTF